MFRRLRGCVIAGSLLLIAAQAAAGLAENCTVEYLPVTVEGQFTACNGQVHYWTASAGYQIYDVAGGVNTTIGLPPNGVNTNGYGDAFGVLDTQNGLFYAATIYGGSDSDVYTYDLNANAWLTPGKAGVTMVNAYGGQVHNGQLYVSGLAEPWNGGYGQANYIFAFDHNAGPDGEARHDTLIETAGNSAYLATAPNGDIYYGSFSTNTLYHWTADQIAGVTEDLYTDGAVDTFLTLSDAVDTWALPGSANGVAVDDAGNVFFSVNSFAGSPSHVLAMIDPTQPDGYRLIYTADGYMDWFGPISIEGDFLNGGTLYFSPTTYGGDGLMAIQYTPEPASLVMLALGAIATLRRRRA